MAQASAYLIFYLLIKFSCGQYESAPRLGKIPYFFFYLNPSLRSIDSSKEEIIFSII